MINIFHISLLGRQQSDLSGLLQSFIISGEVFSRDEMTIVVENFVYDGQGRILVNKVAAALKNSLCQDLRPTLLLVRKIHRPRPRIPVS